MFDGWMSEDIVCFIRSAFPYCTYVHKKQHSSFRASQLCKSPCLLAWVPSYCPFTNAVILSSMPLPSSPTPNVSDPVTMHRAESRCWLYLTLQIFSLFPSKFVARNHSGLEPQGFSNQDGRMGVVVLHGRVCAREEGAGQKLATRCHWNRG
jgi:hypothetical protein